EDAPGPAAGAGYGLRAAVGADPDRLLGLHQPGADPADVRSGPARRRAVREGSSGGIRRLALRSARSSMLHAQSTSIAPGPSALTFIRDFRRDPLHALWGYQRRYGDVVRTTIRGQTYHFLFHPEHATRVLLTGREDFVKQSRDI